MCKKFFIILLLATCAIYSIEAHSFGNPKNHPLLKDMPRSMVCKAWICFKDKPISDELDATSTRSFTSFEDRLKSGVMKAYEKKMLSRTRRRRERRAKYDKPDFTDLPVSKCYIDKVLSFGGIHRATSRCLNAISIEASIDELDQIASLDFVDSIEPVMTYIQKIPKKQNYKKDDSPSRPYMAPTAEHVKIRYGKSYKQIERIKVDALHEKGYHGENILIGLLDTGFDLSHKALIDTDVVGEKDFIYDDGNSADQSQQDDAGQDNHGTLVLSVIAGNAPGYLIGPAFSASYLFGKTEKVSENGDLFEKLIEEDWWIEGIEWMESMGVDVVNGSVGYSDWYKFSDLDGNTAKITKVANLAVEKGVVVVIAAGNMGSIQSDELGLQGHITPPADGFDVLAVGAVNYQGKVAGFSSRGPTYDGRIKPDIMAMGMDTIMVDPETEDAYIKINGTSFASPLIAGTAALLLQAFPNATSKQIVEALRKTASLAHSPNNDYGWGIANAQAAYDFLLAGQVSVKEHSTINLQWARIKSELLDFSLGQNYPNPFNPETWIPFMLKHNANVSLSIYDMQGQLVRQIELGYLPAGVYADRGKAAYWDGVNQYGERTASGYYFYQLRAGDFTATRKMLVIK